MARLVSVGVGALVGLMLLPATAVGQAGTSSIAGVARDDTGLVLPGVTVEVTSPALIEGVRSTVTDGQGQYRIIELRPGTYAVRFILPGFSVFLREGLELPPNFTATVNGTLSIGTLEETITVTGESPLVDVQGVTQRAVINQELLENVPTSKSMLSIAALMPSVVTPANAQDVGGTRGEQSVRISVHGQSTLDQRLLKDGMSYNSLAVEGTGRGYYVNPLAAQEIVVDTGSHGSAEWSLGGAVVNAIPRDGGNRYSGTLFGAWMGHQLQGGNFSDDLRARGLTQVNTTRYIFDTNAALGGPIAENRIWFFTAHRVSGSQTQVANTYRSADLDSFLFTPDLSRPLRPSELLKAHDFRVIAQISSKDKINFNYDYQRNRRDQLTGQLDRGTIAMEANGSYCNLNDLFQGSWTRTHTNQVLFEGGLTLNRFAYGTQWGTDRFLADYRHCGESEPDRVSINDVGIGFTYNGTGVRARPQSNQINGRFSTSYVTGTHHFKAGLYFMADVVHENYQERAPLDAGGLPVAYTFRNGVPISLTQFATPIFTKNHLRPDLGIYVQDRWTLRRLTINAGLRYDYLRQYGPAYEMAAGPLVGARSVPKVDNIPSWHDLNPRFGVAYDLRGDGRTALKGGINRYMRAATVGISSRHGPQQINNTTRSWNDANGNFFPDCDLSNLDANGECGAVANRLFGQVVPAALQPDPDWITGWGKRDYSWQGALSIEHQFADGLAMSAGYYRTWFGNFSVIDNVLAGPDDYDPYCITAPVDPRLGSVSGSQICGLYDIKPEKFGQVQQVETLASNFGKMTEIYNGFDVNFAIRFLNGAQLQGGWNVGNSAASGLAAAGAVSSRVQRCFVVDSPEELRFCDSSPPYMHRFKLSGSYPLPRGVQLALVFQTLPSVNYGASVSVPNAQIAPSLGRNLTGPQARTIQLLEPFSAWLDDRINQLDVRFTKDFRFGSGQRLRANFDVYNFLNAAPVLFVNNTYGPRWLEPQQVLDARLAKISFQLDF